MRIDERFCCFIETFLGNEIDVLVVIVKEDEISFDGETQKLWVLFWKTNIGRDDAFIDEIEIGDLVLFAALFEVLLPGEYESEKQN